MIPTPIVGQRWLSRQLGHFRRSLETLIGRLRGELATTVGRAVGDAVREALHQIGGELRQRPVAPAYRPPASYSSHWDRPEGSTNAWGDDDNEESWRTPEDEYEPPSRHDEPAPRPVEPPTNNDTQTTGSRWSHALRNGLTAGSWWLARMKRFPIAGAAVVAVATALGSYFAGPTLIAGVAGVSLGLFSLADGLAAAAHALNS